MADVTMELMFEVLKSVQARLVQVDGKVDELKQEMQASRTSQNGIRQEITGVFQELRVSTRRWCGTRAVWILSCAVSN